MLLALATLLPTTLATAPLVVAASAVVALALAVVAGAVVGVVTEPPHAANPASPAIPTGTLARNSRRRIRGAIGCLLRPYSRALAKRPTALHVTALALVTGLRLLDLCRLAVRTAHRWCPPPLPAGPGGAPRVYAEESLLLIALLRTLWRLSYRAMRDWLVAWPALALACGLPLGKDGRPRVPSPSQQWKRAAQAGTPPCEVLFVLAGRAALRARLIRARDVIIDSAPILA